MMFARPLALTAVTVLALASGCAQQASTLPADETVGVDSAALNAFDWTWTTDNIKADGQTHTIVAKNVTASGTYTATFNNARIVTTTNSDGAITESGLSWSSVAFSYVTASGTTSATAANGMVPLTYAPSTQIVKTVSAGLFSIKLQMRAEMNDKGNHYITMNDVKMPVSGSTALLPNGRVAVSVSASASNVVATGAPLVGETLTGYYTYSDSKGLSEVDSLYTWWRDGTLVGTGSKTYTPTAADVNHDLKFCVDASNQATAGSSVPRYCSSALPVPSVVVWSGTNFSGTARAFQTPSGGCIKGLVAGDNAGSVVINPGANGVSEGGSCSDSDNLVSSVPAYVKEVTSTLSINNGASYGLSDATSTSIGAIQNNAFNKTANDTTFGNPTITSTPTLSVIYTYQSAPVIQYVVQGDTLSISA
jgi:hypothetical protein